MSRLSKARSGSNKEKYLKLPDILLLILLLKSSKNTGLGSPNTPKTKIHAAKSIPAINQAMKVITLYYRHFIVYSGMEMLDRPV